MFAAGLVKTNNSVWTSWHDTCCVIAVRPRYLRKQYNSISTRSVVAEGKLTGIISVSANDRLITVGAYLKSLSSGCLLGLGAYSDLDAY